MRVCALIPHYKCEEWLDQAIESLLAQTRPLDAIVVIDDCSPEPPIDVVRRYPGVTLLGAREPANVGPYRLVQQVIDDTEFDAYLFQDADDWSAHDRLETLLAVAEETGAELVGSHEVRILVDDAEAQPYRYPLDVNAALVARPSSFPLLHPTSLVTRDLVQRIGGFARGLRFSGDAEFLRRAAHAARVLNVDRYLYFRRKRRDSLTTAADTGLQSPARLAVRARLGERAEANAARVARGEPPDLTPLAVAPPIELAQLGLPDTIRAETSATAVTKPAGGPVFVIGGPRSGISLLTWALEQHPNLTALPDGRWLAEVASAVNRAGNPFPFSSPHLVATTRAVAGHPELAAAAAALVALFPDARFIHVTRPVDEVVDSYVHAPADDDLFLTTDLAAEYWRRTAQAAVEVERAFGAEAVLRVTYGDLIARPGETLTRCLAFLGETSDRACAAPLSGLHPVASVRRQPVPAAVRALNDRLLDGGHVPAVADPDARHRLAQTVAAPALRRSMAQHLQVLVDGAVPPAATVAVASKGDPALVNLEGRRGWHFPQDERGTYVGYHPADGDEAIGQLEALAARGAEYFALPATAFWWLDHYERLAGWLGERCRLVAYQEDAGAIWRLGADPSWRLRRATTEAVPA